MITLIIRRTPSTDEGTVGYWYNGRIPFAYSLELPWLDNDPAGDGDDIVSCIPAGEYVAKYLPVSASGKYRDVYHLQDVPGRSGVLIHAANFAGDKRKGFHSDLLGCIAPARRISKLTPLGAKVSQTAGVDSRQAMQDLHEITGRKDFKLVILDPPEGWR